MDRETERLSQTKRWGVGAVQGQTVERWRGAEGNRAGWAERNQTHTQIEKETRNGSKAQTVPEEMGWRQRWGREGGPRSPGALSLCLPTGSGPAAQPLGRQPGCPLPISPLSTFGSPPHHAQPPLERHSQHQPLGALGAQGQGHDLPKPPCAPGARRSSVRSAPEPPVLTGRGWALPASTLPSC